MAKLIVELPEKAHTELKKMALLHHTTIKQVVTNLVEEFLANHPEKKPLTETGLCGKWNDQRSPDEILSDIKSHRNWFNKEVRGKIG